MSQENVELVRSIYAAWECGDFGSVDWAHPEIEFVIADGPAPGKWSGVAGIEEPWREFLSTWEEYRTEADEYRVLDGERVLVLGALQRARQDKRAGARGDTYEASKRVPRPRRQGDRLILYWDREHARADLGLARL